VKLGIDQQERSILREKGTALPKAQKKEEGGHKIIPVPAEKKKGGKEKDWLEASASSSRPRQLLNLHAKRGEKRKIDICPVKKKREKREERKEDSNNRTKALKEKASLIIQEKRKKGQRKCQHRKKRRGENARTCLYLAMPEKREKSWSRLHTEKGGTRLDQDQKGKKKRTKVKGTKRAKQHKKPSSTTARERRKNH